MNGIEDEVEEKQDYARPFFDRHTGEVGLYLDVDEAICVDAHAYGSDHLRRVDLNEKLGEYLAKRDLIKIKAELDRRGHFRGVVLEEFRRAPADAVLALVFDTLEALQDVCKLQEGKQLQTLFQTLLVDKAVHEALGVRKLTLRARLWPDEVEACEAELMEMEQHKKREDINDRLRLLHRFSSYSSDTYPSIQRSEHHSSADPGGAGPGEELPDPDGHEAPGTAGRRRVHLRSQAAAVHRGGQAGAAPHHHPPVHPPGVPDQHEDGPGGGQQEAQEDAAGQALSLHAGPHAHLAGAGGSAHLPSAAADPVALRDREAARAQEADEEHLPGGAEAAEALGQPGRGPVPRVGRPPEAWGEEAAEGSGQSGAAGHGGGDGRGLRVGRVRQRVSLAEAALCDPADVAVGKDARIGQRLIFPTSSWFVQNMC